MRIQIDKSIKTPLYKQIAEQIQSQIISGEIPDGFQFPSERQLADTLGVNRTTVLNAYKELKADGLLTSHVGRGTIAVKETAPAVRKTESRKEPMWEYLFSDYLKNRDTFDVNKYLEMANQKDVISFAAGIASFENP
ncbi:winged helix-turn-helix domain-containing protein, partial [Blautia pseudococcoides]|nr:winged helix-turn-helix domain-containing protein [Blautia pseudococcoides]